ncbi:MAG: site-specific integrase [Candidatus Parvarchaeota archaeon]
MSSLVPRPVAIQSSTSNLSIEFFSDEEIQRIFSLVTQKMETDKRRASYHQRYFLLFMFLLRTGGRIDEVLVLTPSDINLNLNVVRMKTLKQGRDIKTGLQKEKYRTIPLHPALRDAYMRYLLENHIRQDSTDALFPLKRQVVDLYMKKIQKATGIRVHAHKFRHTFAVRAILDGVPLNVLQQWMGHSSIFTTSIYTQITGMDTSEFMRRMR